MSEHKARERDAERENAEQQRREMEGLAQEAHAADVAEHERESHETKKERDHDILAKDEPFVLESTGSNPEFPALNEFEVDEGGAPGSTKKHPGLIWAIIAIVAVVILIVAFIAAGDWFTPNQAERNAQLQFEEQTVPEDLGAN